MNRAECFETDKDATDFGAFLSRHGLWVGPVRFVSGFGWIVTFNEKPYAAPANRGATRETKELRPCVNFATATA